MTAKIKQVHVAAPKEVLVAHLEKLLEHAKSGELQGMAYSAQWSGMNFSEHFAGVNLEYSRTYIGSLELLRDMIAADYFADP